MDRIVTASNFKAHCLALLDEVAETGESLVVTKRGRAVAQVAPVQAPASLRGSVTFKVSDQELIAPLPEHWDVAEQ
ncbi:MAG TPA: type II toxin-antitoxin system Phd/YefM family antitoxin [Solirubrobacteraceae bacterium]|nr:type II toxin-antitoxin system Phd/YefM family antitoxin [Solirubrobacteraceae bacterium]